MQLHIHESDDGIIVVTVDGGLDSGTSRELAEALDQLLRQGSSRMVLDCSRLVYISSWGIASLVRLRREMRRRDGDVKLVKPQHYIFEVLRTTHLAEMFEIYEDIDRARLAFRPPAPRPTPNPDGAAKPTTHEPQAAYSSSRG